MCSIQKVMAYSFISDCTLPITDITDRLPAAFAFVAFIFYHHVFPLIIIANNVISAKPVTPTFRTGDVS